MPFLKELTSGAVIAASHRRQNALRDFLKLVQANNLRSGSGCKSEIFCQKLTESATYRLDIA